MLSLWYPLNRLCSGLPLAEIMNKIITTSRALSIDIFRGFTIFTMVFVNELSGTADIPYWMKHFHKNVDGMSFVDLVFPAFLFIVGMSIAFAVQARVNKGDSTIEVFKHIALRSLGLIVIGVFMVNSESGYDEKAMSMSMPLWSLLIYISVILIWANYSNASPRFIPIILKLLGVGILVALWITYKGENGGGMTPQWWGILGLIGWAYLIACCCYLLSKLTKSANVQVFLLIVAALSLFLIFLGLNTITPEQGTFLAILDDNRGNLTHSGIVLGGLILSQLFFHPSLTATRLRNYCIFAFTTLLLAFASWHVCPISKIGATPSWGLFSIFFCSIIFGFIYWLVDIKKQQNWGKLFEPAAINPLFVYLIPDIIGSLTAIFSIDIRPAFFHAGIAGIIWSLCFAAMILFFGSIVNRTGFRLKL